MSLLSDFKTRFPDIGTVTADKYVGILEPVIPHYYGGAYDGVGKEITLQLLAHLVTVESARGNGPTRSETSKSVGSVSVSYESATASGGALYDFFRTTRYGQQFLLLTRRNIGPRVG